MHKHIIAMLEDDADRAARMVARLKDALPFKIRVFVGETREMTEWLNDHLDEVLLISLDHDLNLLPGADGKLIDPGCGRDLSKYLARRQATCPVIIHSTNVPAAQAMQSELEDAGWKVDRITPYGDLAWVDEAWLPLVRSALGRT